MNLDELANRFTFHPAETEEKAQAHEDIRGLCLTLAKSLNFRLPEGSEKDLAITNLEQTMFWANAAIARRTD